MMAPAPNFLATGGRLLKLLMALLVVHTVLAGPAWAHEDEDDSGGGGSGKPREQYDLIVSGYFEGEGKAQVKDDDTIHIQAQVRSVDGKTNINLPKVTGRFREVGGVVIGTFSGTYTVGGKPIILMGKIEPPDEDSEARLTGTYIYDGDKFGRLVGYVKGSKKGKKKP